MKRYPPLTVTLIICCVLVAALSDFGASKDVLAPFLISSLPDSGLLQLRSGQLWRILTPIFIHFSILHLLFNMMWLWDLGKLIESYIGATKLTLLVVTLGIVSNLAQYLITDIATFGGMSGVVYGLLGFVWMQGRYNPAFGFIVHKNTVILMLIWFVLCWTGLFGPIANWAHTAGLGLGMVCGYWYRGKQTA